MNLYKIRGGTREDLEDRKYTIGVGISLGNKWFSVDNIISLTEWSLKYSKSEVIVYVADHIHSINLEVRNRISDEKAVEKANKQGDDILNAVRIRAEESLSDKEVNRIVYVKWNDITDDRYKEKVSYLKDLYNQPSDFQNTIHQIVRGFTSKEERIFTDTEIHRLGEYLVEEMPEIINRVPMKGIICDAYTYPYDGKMTELAEEIQKGLIFPEIRENIMDTEPKVFLEVR